MLPAPARSSEKYFLIRLSVLLQNIFSTTFFFPSPQSDNVTRAAVLRFIITRNTSPAWKENVPFCMHLFRALESVGEQEVKDGEGEKKTRSLCLTLFSPTHHWAITVHATRRLPDSVTAQSVFRCMNKTFRHLFLEVAPRKQDKTRERGTPPSPGPSTHSVKPQLFTAYFSGRPTPNGDSTCILVTKGLWLNPIPPFCPSHFHLPLRFVGSRLRCRASRFLPAEC